MQNIENIFKTKEPIIDHAEFEQVVDEYKGILDEIKLDDTVKKLYEICYKVDDIEEINQFAAHVNSCFDDVVVIGIGGSNLGAKTFTDLTAFDRIHYMDNIDPHTISKTLDRLNLQKTAFLLVSKSGNTVETLANSFVCLERYKAQGLEELICKNFFVITDQGDDNSLRALAVREKLRVFDWQSDIGGRFSAFTLTSLIPAAICGLDILKIRQGAVAAIKDSHENLDALKGAVLNFLLMQKGYHTTVMMPYVDRLITFNDWFSQLWAESLGKDGQGSLPNKAVGTIDQHSLLQLYLDGKQDKFFNIIQLEGDSVLPAIKGEFADESTAYLSGHNLCDLMNKFSASIIQSLRENNCPVRVFELSSLDEHSIGHLMMHFILETIITARILNINPFGQPAVEGMKQILAEKLGV